MTARPRSAEGAEEAGNVKTEGLAIYCADIGLVKKGNFEWAVMHGDCQRGGKEIGGLVDDVVDSLSAGVKVALGFECPLWVPVPDDPAGVTAGRGVDGNRAWSAGAGASVLAAGSTETAWILREIRERLRDRSAALPAVLFDWQEFARLDRGVYLWEAFVTGDAKAKGERAGKDAHMADALTACTEFAARLPDPAAGGPSESSGAVRSLIGAAVLWTGWSEDLALIRSRCLILKPAGPET